MELKDFISETITQIVAGVTDARIRVSGLNVVARVNPFIEPIEGRLAKHDLAISGGDAVQFVKFNISITTNQVEGGSTKAGIFVLPFGLSAGIQSNQENNNVSNISFIVPLTLPRETSAIK